MRKFFFTALFVLALCACAFADASLYRGTSRVGVVQTIENNLVPVDDVGKLLGFTASRSGEELTLTRGSVTLRVIANSAAAWQGFSIVPLHSSPVDKNGKLWVDAQSAVALFQNTAGTRYSEQVAFHKFSKCQAHSFRQTDRRSRNVPGADTAENHDSRKAHSTASNANASNSAGKTQRHSDTAGS